MLIACVMQWAKSLLSHLCIFQNISHLASSICLISNYELFWIISKAGNKWRVTLFPQSIGIFRFQVRTRYIKILEWREYSFNYIIQWLFHNFETFWGTWDLPNENPVALLGVMWIYFQILPFVKHSGQEW